MNQNVAILNRPLKKYMMEFIKTFKEYKIKIQTVYERIIWKSMYNSFWAITRYEINKKANHFNKYKLPSYAHCLFQNKCKLHCIMIRKINAISVLLSKKKNC